MQHLAPIITVPRRFWDREYGGYPLPKAVTVTFEVAGQPVDDVSARGYVSVAEDSELRLSGLWAVSHDRFPGHLVIGWAKVGDDTIKLQLQPPDSPDEHHTGIDRKRQAPADLPEPQAKVPALGARQPIEWDNARDPVGHPALLDWRPEGREALRLTVDPPQRGMGQPLQPSRLTPRRGGSGGRMRGGSRATTTGRGCAKLVRTTTRLYIGVGQVREWLGEVGARTELQVKVMLDNRMLNGLHQADLLYNKGAHYYWITSRTLKRTAMGKWFLGWSHTPADGLVLLLRSPSKDEIAAAIAEGFQGKDEEDETEVSEQQQMQQQQMLMAMSPPSPRQPFRAPPSRSLPPMGYPDDEAMLMLQQQQQLPNPGAEVDEMAEPGQYQRSSAPLGAGGGGARLGAAAGDEDDAVSGLSGDSELRRAAGPSDPRLMAALAAADVQRGYYGTPAGPGPSRRMGPGFGVAHRRFSSGAGGRDLRESTPQPLHGGRTQPIQTPGSAPGSHYREPLARGVGEGLAGAGAGLAAGGTPHGPPRGSSGRLTNFSEVPGGTAFANVALTPDGLAAGAPLAQPPQQQLQQQQLRGGAAAVPSQLGATTSIASNLSLPGATQMTGNASLLEASGVAGPIAAPLRLPPNVSELLPPEYLPAAVSVRCTVDGNLQDDVYACEIHRSGRGHCYLYHLPPTVLEGRAQQDWMISEDGCLVLCLQTMAQPQALIESKSVRSNPNQGAPLVGGGSVNPAEDPGTNTRANALTRVPSGADQPGAGGGAGARPARLEPSAPDLAAAPAVEPHAQDFPAGPAAEAAAAATAKPPLEQPDELMLQAEDPPADAVAFTTVVPQSDPAPVAALLPVLDRKADGRRAQLLVPRQAIESLYGLVDLPYPVVVQFQINGDLAPQVYLAEVCDGGAGELVIRGTPPEMLSGRTLVGWSRTNVLSHQLLVVCLEARPDSVPEGKAATGPSPLRKAHEDDFRRPRGDQPGGLQQSAAGHTGQGQQHHQVQPQQRATEQQPQQHDKNTPGDAHFGPSRQHAGGAAANPFGQQHHVTLSGPTAISGSQHRGHHHPHHHHQAGAAPPAAGPQRLHLQHQQQPHYQQHQHRRPSGDSSAPPGAPQPLQPMLSGPLPVVGSSKLPPSFSLQNNTGSNLLPAQASNLPNLPFAASVRLDAQGASAVAGHGATRPADAGGRGGGIPGGPRTQTTDIESRGNALPTLASVTHDPAQAHATRLQGSARAPAPFGWPPDAGTAGQGSERVAPSVFAQVGPGVGPEPPSPKALQDPLPPAKRQQPQQQPQPQAAPAGRSGGSGSGGSGPRSGSNDGGLMPRHTAQTADYSSAIVGSQTRAAQQHPPMQQPSLLQAARQHEEGEGDHDLRRSPARGTGAAADQDLAGAPRPRWPPVGPGSSDNDTQRLAAAGANEPSQAALRYGPSRGVHREGSGGTTADAGGSQGQDELETRQQHQAGQQQQQQHAQQQRAWRYESSNPQQQPPQPEVRTAAGAAAQEQHASGQQGSREARWGPYGPPPVEAGSGSTGDQRPQAQQQRYVDEAHTAAASRQHRPFTDEMDTGRDEAPQVALGPPGSRAAEGPQEDRSLQGQGLARRGDQSGGTPGGFPDGSAAARRSPHDGSAAAQGDVEMEDAAPGPPGMPAVHGQPEGARRPHAPGPGVGTAVGGGDPGPAHELPGRGPRSVGRSVDGSDGLDDSFQHGPQHSPQQPQLQQAPRPAGGSQWQRHGDGCQGAMDAPPARHQQQQQQQQPLEQQPSEPSFAAAVASEAARQAPARGGGLPVGLAAERGPQPQWFPRLDLTGATASGGPEHDAGALRGDKELGGRESVARRGSDQGESGEAGERPPPQRAVLRMLSSVKREPEEVEVQRQPQPQPEQ